ncbi:hypothetical protein Tco_0451832 [Tanacetum coccineum]
MFRYGRIQPITYTAVSGPFEDGSDIGSPGVDGPPIMPEDPYAYIMAAYQVPPSPDYIPGPEEPQSPPPLDFVPEPMYPEYIPQEDEILLAEEQPLPAAASPTANHQDEDEDEEKEEEHPALADPVPPVHRMTAKISIRDEPSISLPPREEVEILLALTTPPPSLLTPLSSPLPHIPSPLFPASPPASPIRLTDRPEITLPPQKRLGIDLGPRYEIGESSAAAATRPIGGRRADYGSDLVVSFPSGTKNKIFDPGLFIEVQSKRFLLPDKFSISFIHDPPFPVIDTLLPFSSENEDKVVNPGILAACEEKSPHLLSHRGFKAF